MRIDDTAPSGTDDAPAGWVAPPAAVHLGATDALSGVAGIAYSLDGSVPSILATSVLTVSAEGTTTLKYATADVAGNIGETVTATLRLDGTAPEVFAAPAATYAGTATVPITATDPLSGVAYTRYRVDGSAWTTGTVATVSTGGPHTLDFFAADTVGNASGVSSVSFDVLKRYEETSTVVAYKGTWAPAAHASRSSGSWYFSNVSGAAAYVNFTGTRVDLIGSKAASYGIARITVDGEAPVLVDLYAPSTAHQAKLFSATGLANTAHTMRIERTGTKNPASTGTGIGVDAIDVVGALSADTVAPVSSAVAESAWTSTPVTVTVSAADAHSFVDRTYVRIGSTTTTYTAPVVVTAEGTTTVEYWSVDGAGNTETPKTLAVRIDHGAPNTTDDAPVAWSQGPVLVHLAATDATSGRRLHPLLHRRLGPEHPLHRQPDRGICRGHHHDQSARPTRRATPRRYTPLSCASTIPRLRDRRRSGRVGRPACGRAPGCHRRALGRGGHRLQPRRLGALDPRDLRAHRERRGHHHLEVRHRGCRRQHRRDGDGHTAARRDGADGLVCLRHLVRRYRHRLVRGERSAIRHSHQQNGASMAARGSRAVR